MQQRTVIGLDIGGTSTRGLRADGPAAAPGPELVIGAEASGGSSNVQNVSRDQARQRLAAVLEELGAPGLDPAAQHLDVVIGADEGIALIAGTGSVAWGRTAEGSEARRGGWGYLLGDEGSSFWVGREAVRRALCRADADEPADELDRAVLETRGLGQRSELIADFHDRFERTAWAGLATHVDRCASAGHLGARELLEAAAGHLIEMAAGVAEQLSLTGPIVLGGGLGSSSILVEALAERAAAAGLSAPEPLRVPPVHGTLRLAEA